MKTDTAQLIRFLITGSVVACFYVAAYTLLIYAGQSPFAANFLSFSPAVVVQYIMQTCWTFRRPLFDGAQSVRFAIVIGIGLIYSSVITSMVGPALEWLPFISAGLVAVTLPIINFTFFRLWVYRSRPLEEVNL